ncbi:hypothetical protein HYW75_00185 [Candidatus Pacearchaeota archaeon]|nr:hypothetical protein [Candidatus Pacearchaeota archaeon]
MTPKQIEVSIREGTFREPVQTELTLFSSDQPLYIHNGSLVKYSPPSETLLAKFPNCNDKDFNKIHHPSHRDHSSYNRTIIAQHRRQIRAIQRQEMREILQQYPLTQTPAEVRDYIEQHLALFPPD